MSFVSHNHTHLCWGATDLLDPLVSRSVRAVQLGGRKSVLYKAHLTPCVPNGVVTSFCDKSEIKHVRSASGKTTRVHAVTFPGSGGYFPPLFLVFHPPMWRGQHHRLPEHQWRDVDVTPASRFAIRCDHEFSGELDKCK